MTDIPKYPRTLYWPTSPTSPNDGRRLKTPKAFVGPEVLITEKIDGGNTLLHRGQVYSRSTSAPSTAPWMAMVKKRHAWKTTNMDCLLYGEDIYGVHSISYDPVAEDSTFYAFALRRDNRFESFDAVRRLADSLRVPTVPLIWRGRFRSIDAIDELLADAHARPSRLGGEREGLVIRLADAFRADQFDSSVCKSVRENHVQTDRHWSRNWRPCPMKPAPRISA